ncbi:MAG: hypothetical protein IT559_03970 [Alphaproteobacteria bacterium]|nr:hypothetical protein [Alphaproteobacteria bacterium]
MAETSKEAPYDSVKQEDILKVRDWINTNRDELSSLLKLKMPDETAIMEIPKSTTSYSDPAFSTPYLKISTIAELMELDGQENALINEFKETSAAIAPLNEPILAHANIYEALGITLDKSPDDVVESFMLLRTKMLVAEISDEKALGDLPAFDYKNNPFDAQDPAFIEAFNALGATLETNNLGLEDMLAAADETLKNAHDSGKTIFEEKEILKEVMKMPPAQRIAWTFSSGIIEIKPEQEGAIRAAVTFHAITQTLPPTIAQKIEAAIINPQAAAATKIAKPTTQEAQPQKPEKTEATEAPETAEAPETEEAVESAPPPAVNPLDQMVWEAHPAAFMAAVMAAEGALNIKPMDGLYDGATQIKIENFVVDVFEKYGSSYLQDGVRIHANPPSNKPYEFDENGNIYALDVVNEKLVRGPKVGDIRQGIQQRDGKTRPHEATIALFNKIWMDQEDYLRTRKIEHAGGAYSEQEKTIREQLQKINRLDLERDLRAQLKKHGADSNAFQNSEAYKTVAALDPAGADDFLFILLSQQSAKHIFGGDITEREIETGRIGAVFNLLHFMGTNETFDPAQHANIKAGALVRDNILARGAYDVLRHMSGGDLVRVDILYDEAIPGQKESILAAFGDRQAVSREDIYAYVQKEFEDRAIARLSKEENIDRLTPAERQEILKGVSQAMANGDFNPYEKDVELAYKGLGRPNIQDPQVRSMIDRARANGDFPGAEFALDNMRTADLIEITGRNDFNDLSRSEKLEILQPLMYKPSQELQQNAAYERMMINFHERAMGNFTWWRNGEVGANDNDTWNGRYGAPDENQLLHIYMRYNWHNLDQKFGTETADLMRDSVGNLNFDVTLEGVMSQISPEAQQKLRAGVDELSRPSMYTYLMDLRRDHYRDLRNQKYIPTLQQLSLSEGFKGAAHAEHGHDGAASDLQNNGTNENNPDSGADATGTNGLDGAEGAGEEDHAKVGIPIEDRAEGNPFWPVKGGPGILAWKKANPVSAPAPLVSEANKLLKSPPSNAIQPKVLHGTVLGPENKATAALSKIGQTINGTAYVYKPVDLPPGQKLLNFSPDALRALTYFPKVNPLVPITSGSIVNPATKGGALATIAKTLPATPAAIGKEGLKGTDILKGAAGMELFNNVAKTKSTIIGPNDANFLKDIAAKYPDSFVKPPTAPAATSKIPITTQIASTFSEIAKGAGSGVKSIIRALPLIGGGVATAEVGFLTVSANDMVKAGLMPEDARIALAALYSAHIAQSGLDISGFGGEAATWYSMNTIAQKYDLDPVVASIVSPVFFTKFVKSYFDDEGDIENRDLNLMRDRYANDEALQEKFYAPLIKKYSLPETVPVEGHGDLPLGIAIRLPGVADKLREENPEMSEGLKYLQTVNEVAGQARELIQKAEIYLALKDNKNDITQLAEQQPTTTPENALAPLPG